MLIYCLINCVLFAVLLHVMQVSKKEMLLVIGAYTFVLAFLANYLRYHNLSLIVIYLILYLLKIGVFYYFSRGHFKAVIPNIVTISSITYHLIVLAITAIIFQMPLVELIFSNIKSIYCLLMLCDAMLILIVIFRRNTFIDLYNYNNYDDFKEFIYFLWFSLFLVLIQSFMYQAESFPSNTSYFLIGNNILLQILILVFVRNVHALIKQANVKKENTYLKQEEELRRKRTESLMEHADYDVLTKARSRRWILNHIDELFTSHSKFSIVFIDLNRLKEINDEFGHSSGDRYLRYFTEEMLVYMKPGDHLGRIGGDEFLFVVIDETYQGTVNRMNVIKQQIKNPFNQKLNYFSYGIAENSSVYTSAQELIEAADQSMYMDKRNQVKMYE